MTDADKVLKHIELDAERLHMKSSGRVEEGIAALIKTFNIDGESIV